MFNSDYKCNNSLTNNIDKAHYNQAEVSYLHNRIDSFEKQVQQFKDSLSINSDSHDFNPHNRNLEEKHIKVLLDKWVPLLGLDMKANYLKYFAHKICQIEDVSFGRLATTIEDAMLRVLVAMSIKKESVSILEIGALYGIALAAYYNCLRGFFSSAHLTAIDPLEGFYEKNKLDFIIGTPINKNVFEHNMVVNNIPPESLKLIQALSTDKNALSEAKKRKYDLLIIDGDHSYEGVKFDFENYSKFVNVGGFIFFDDYNKKDWPGVVEFVDEVVKNKKNYHLLGIEWRSAVFKKMK